MPSFRHVEAAKSGRRLTHGVITVIIAFVLLAVSQIGGGLAVTAVFPQIGATLGDVGISGLSLTQFSLLLIAPFGLTLALVLLWVRLFEGRGVRTLGFTRGDGIRKFLAGAALGLIAISVVAAGLWIPGFVTPAKDVSLLPSASALAPIALLLLAWAIQGTAEETLARGYMLQDFAARHGVLAAVIVTSVFFAAVHGTNPHTSAVFFLNVFLISVFLALFALGEGGIWGVSGFHFSWNMAQVNIYGFPSSGAVGTKHTVIAFENTGADLLTGGAVGPEGGLIATGLFVIMLILAWHYWGWNWQKLKPASHRNGSPEEAL